VEVGRGRKPAQPSIPEGILGFPSPDPDVLRTRETKAVSLKLRALRPSIGVKNPRIEAKFPVRCFTDLVQNWLPVSCSYSAEEIKIHSKLESQ
jgi:hypothetical protein